MLVFLYLTLLLGVSLSQSQAAVVEVQDVDGLDVDEDPRSKRQSCSSFCQFTGGRCLAEGESDETCEFTQHLECTGDLCNCCQKCASVVSPCGTMLDGACRKRGECSPEQYADNNVLCKDPSACCCCRPCKTPSTCSNPNGEAACFGDIAAMMKMPEYYPNPTGSCEPVQGCSCYNKCQGTQACINLGGKCVHKDQECEAGFVKYACGCTDSENCRCCVPSGVSAESAESDLGCSSSEDTSDTSD